MSAKVVQDNDDRAGASAVLTGSKTIDSRALNLAGVQPLRAVLARLLYNLRRGPHEPMISDLARTGILTCEDFLPPAAFTALQREAEDYMGESAPTLLHHGSTEVRHFPLEQVDAERFPHLAQWPDHQQVMALAAAAERRKCRGRSQMPLIEEVRVGDYSEPDPQTRLHADTFFNTHKIWLYLDDVDDDDAAFVYVPGSHLLDRVRLREDYLESTRTNEASRRVTDEEIRSRGLEQRIVRCPRNTLLVANTCGYHCRGVGDAGTSRRALFMMFRFNPFAPEKWTRARLKRWLVR